jgi:hypothetical protein
MQEISNSNNNPTLSYKLSMASLPKLDKNTESSIAIEQITPNLLISRLSA